MAEYILDVKGLKTFYRTRLKENVYAVDGVDLHLKEGRVLGIAGESGCGKSTLATSLMGFYFPPLHYGSGQIVLDGTDIMSIPYETLRKNFLGTEIAYIPQAAMNALNQTRKVSKFVVDILKEHRPDLSKEQMLNLAREKFEFLNLPERVLSAYPSELSGGMKQRTVIALSTLLNPKVLIADEPSSALDVSSQKIVISMLKKMMKEGFVKSMIFITHELPLLRHVADDIVVMYAGELVEEGKITKQEAMHHPHKNYITRAIGTSSMVQPEIRTLDRKSGDVWLLCSDGMSNYIEDGELERILREQADRKKCVRQLIDLALERGGADNITLLIVVCDGGAL